MRTNFRNDYNAVVLPMDRFGDNLFCPALHRTSPRCQSSSCQARFPNAALRLPWHAHTLALAHVPRALSAL